jgi:hypothetical protein
MKLSKATTFIEQQVIVSPRPADGRAPSKIRREPFKKIRPKYLCRIIPRCLELPPTHPHPIKMGPGITPLNHLIKNNQGNITSKDWRTGLQCEVQEESNLKQSDLIIQK